MSTQIEMTPKWFDAHVVAQADDDDYQESGYVVVELEDGRYALTNYSHCSCYATWTAICDGDWGNSGDAYPTFLWVGSRDALIGMAQTCSDPAMSDRHADEEDSDYQHLVSVYKQVLKHFGEE